MNEEAGRIARQVEGIESVLYGGLPRVKTVYCNEVKASHSFNDNQTLQASSQ